VFNAAASSLAAMRARDASLDRFVHHHRTVVADALAGVGALIS